MKPAEDNVKSLNEMVRTLVNALAIVGQSVNNEDLLIDLMKGYGASSGIPLTVVGAWGKLAYEDRTFQWCINHQHCDSTKKDVWVLHEPSKCKAKFISNKPNQAQNDT